MEKTSAYVTSSAHKDLTDQFKEQMDGFDFAFACAIFTKVNAANDPLNTRREYRELARQAGEQIKNDQDRTFFFSDFNAGNWFDIE